MPKILLLNARQFQDGGAARLGFLKRSSADIALVQDFPADVEADAEFRRSWPIRHFVPMTNHFGRAKIRVPVGLGIFSRKLPFVSTEAHAYVGNVLPTPTLNEKVVLFDDERANAVNAALLEESESRMAIFVTLDINGSELVIGNTHGPWRRHGVIDESFRTHIRKLAEIVKYRFQYAPLVLGGVFNFARGSDVYDEFVKECELDDSIPPVFKNTLDRQFTGSTGPDAVTSFIFRRMGPKVYHVKLTFGLSHHAAITATVTA